MITRLLKTGEGRSVEDGSKDVAGRRTDVCMTVKKHAGIV
jgi:hypothetical protein